MNPQELVNQDVKANANNFLALKALKDLMINLRYYLKKFNLMNLKLEIILPKKRLDMLHVISNI